MQKQYRGPMSYHICMSIETALDMTLYRNGYQLETNEDGIGLSDTANPDIRDVLSLPKDMKQWDIVKELEDMKKAGMTAIPSEGCDNHTAGHCNGHVKRGVASGSLHR